MLPTCTRRHVLTDESWSLNEAKAENTSNSIWVVHLVSYEWKESVGTTLEWTIVRTSQGPRTQAVS